MRKLIGVFADLISLRLLLKVAARARFHPPLRAIWSPTIFVTSICKKISWATNCGRSAPR